MMKEITGIKRYIREVLKRRGLYSPELGYQIETAARDIMLYRKLSDESLKPETEIMIAEISREGEKRYKINPIFDAVKKHADVVRNDLKALCMNRSAKKLEDTQGDDAMEELMKSLNG